MDRFRSRSCIRQKADEAGALVMRNPQKAPSADVGFGGQAHREAMLQRHFDHAAYSFYIRYCGDPPELSIHDFLVRFERAVVFEALLRTHGSQKDTAAFLKLKKQTLNMKVKRQHILIIKQLVKQPI
jgi:DNA-binding NtrC family response regulator